MRSLTSNSTNSGRFSTASVQAGQLRPGRKVLCSLEAGWTSVLLQTYEQPPLVESYESAVSPDQLLVFVLRGQYNIESFSGRSWKKAAYRPGIGGLTSPLTTNRLRWHSPTTTEPLLLRLYIPQIYFDEAGEAYRRAGQRSASFELNTLVLSDPLLFTMAKTLAQEVERGAPDVCAEAGARFLTTHLLSKTTGWSERHLSKGVGVDLNDRRLARVLDYMEHQCTAPITLDQLAAEAGISRFHFARLFKAKLGMTPHQHLVRLRMKHAQMLLQETDLPVAEIALACGYVHGGHFSAAFVDSFGVTPAFYREQQR